MAIHETARFLQIPAKDKPLDSSLQFLIHLDKGFPVSSVDKVAVAFAPKDFDFRYRIVPKATLARLKAKQRKHKAQRLSKPQSELVARLAAVWTDAIRAWKTEEGARNFLYRKHPLLEDKRPVDLALQSELGAQIVRDILGRLEHATAV
jgi:putative toxin-antitoxin system antitoxin component (TIGR02293 family)